MKGKFTYQEAELFSALEAKKAPIQAELDKYKLEERAAMERAHAIREKIKAVKPDLVPYAEMQAGLANSSSRDKYFPDMSKNQFIEHVKEQI